MEAPYCADILKEEMRIGWLAQPVKQGRRPYCDIFAYRVSERETLMTLDKGWRYAKTRASPDVFG